MGDDYHDHPADVVTSSSLRDFIRSPKLYHDRYVSKTLPRRQSDAMLFGSAVHMAVLQHDIFDDHYYADPYNVRSLKSRALAEENTGKIRLTRTTYDLCWAIAKAAWDHPQSMECREGDVEKPMEARMRNGLTVRSKPDIINGNGNGIDDFKTLGQPMCFFESFE